MYAHLLFLVYPEFIPESPPLDSQQGNVSTLAFEFTLGVCLLACLPGVGGPLGGGANARNALFFPYKLNSELRL